MHAEVYIVPCTKKTFETTKLPRCVLCLCGSKDVILLLWLGHSLNRLRERKELGVQVKWLQHHIYSASMNNVETSLFANVWEHVDKISPMVTICTVVN